RKPIANDLIYMANAMDACVVDGSRGDDCAPRPPLAGEGRDGGRVRGGRLPPTPTPPRSRGRERVARAGRGGPTARPVPRWRGGAGTGPGPRRPTPPDPTLPARGGGDRGRRR